MLEYGVYHFSCQFGNKNWLSLFLRGMYYTLLFPYVITLAHIETSYKWENRFGFSSIGSIPHSSDCCILPFEAPLAQSLLPVFFSEGTLQGVGIAAFAVYQRGFIVLLFYNIIKALCQPLQALYLPWLAHQLLLKMP